jgi:5-methylcytosine-specific restriction endonuclease McrA
MNHYKCSNGDRVTQPEIERKMREAKRQLLQNQIFDFGYNFCEQEGCGNNGSGTRLDCSHKISILKAKQMNQTELAWDVNNLNVLCRACHEKKDGLNIQHENTKK